MKVLVICLLLLSFSSFNFAVGQSIELTTASGNGADAMVRAGSNSSSNFGDVIAVAVKDAGDSSPVTRKTYLRFDLTELPAPIENAELVLSVTTPEDPCNPTAPHTINVHGLQDGVASKNWNEQFINWTNAPANDTGSGGGLLASAPLLGSFTVACQDLKTADEIQFSNQSLVDFLNASKANSVVTFILTDGSQINSSIGYATKEHTKQPAPTLRLTLNVLLGDVNNDNRVDLLDVVAFVTLLQTETYQLEADINLDSRVDLLDVSPFIELLIG